MTGTVTYIYGGEQYSSTEAATSKQMKASEETVSLTATGEVERFADSKSDKTSIREIVEYDRNGRISQVKRIYPHVFDDEVISGQARVNLLSALDDARLALEAFGEADIQSISTRLTLIATTMSNTHRATEFNESLGAVVSFLRRSMLTASAAEITRPALNALVHVIQHLSNNPMIDLDEAAEMVDKLSTEGWQGEEGFADALISTLLDDLDTGKEATAQQRLFDEHLDEIR